MEISVHELKKKMDLDDKLQVLDVREPIEVAYGIIPNALLIPMSDIPKKLSKLNDQKDLYIYCKSGIRSARVCEYLLQKNFKNVYNIKGGIVSWSREIDQTIKVL